MKLEAYVLERKVRIIKEVRIQRGKVWSWIISRAKHTTRVPLVFFIKNAKVVVCTCTCVQKL
jgi:hypothetical protein